MHAMALAELRKKITEEMRDKQQAVARGVCSTYDSYRFEVGIIRGLATSLDILSDIEKRFMDGDDD